MIEDKTPLEAFEWLLGQFRAYSRNQIIWLDVRNILTAGDEFLMKAKEAPPEQEEMLSTE